MNILELSDFIVKLQDFAKENGAEIKTTKQGVVLWPTYDTNGALSTWFCLYIRPAQAETQETHE